MQKSNKYWVGRFEQVEQAANNKSVRYTKQLDKKYKVAAQEIDGKINAWYQRIATNNNVSITDAKKLLTKSELKEFKWTVEEYIKYGEENAIDQMWLKELENASAKFHINRLEALKLECRQQIEVALANGQESMFDVLGDVYKDSFYRTCFEVQKGVGVGFDVSKLDNGQVSRILSKPWSVDGTNFSQKLWGNKTKLLNNLDQELSRMILTGASPNKAIQNIRKSMNTSLFNAKRLVMTEQAYFTSLAQKDAFTELDVEEYEFVGTLDGRTCSDCGRLDGQHFPIIEMKPGINAAPMHPFCRCTTAPYFNDEFSASDMRVAKDKEGNTYEIPASIKYNEWKKIFADDGSKDELKAIKTLLLSHVVSEEILANVVKSVTIKPTKTISGHSSTPKEAEPNDIIDHMREDGTVDARGFYGDDGMKKKDIHTTDHGNPKHHTYGEHGEHGHDYEWNEDGSLKEKTTRELREDERKENGDIL